MYQAYLVGVPDAPNKDMVESLIRMSRRGRRGQADADQKKLDATRGAGIDVEKNKAEDARKAKGARPRRRGTAQVEVCGASTTRRRTTGTGSHVDDFHGVLGAVGSGVGGVLRGRGARCAALVRRAECGDTTVTRLRRSSIRAAPTAIRQTRRDVLQLVMIRGGAALAASAHDLRDRPRQLERPRAQAAGGQHAAFDRNGGALAKFLVIALLVALAVRGAVSTRRTSVTARARSIRTATAPLTSRRASRTPVTRAIAPWSPPTADWSSRSGGPISGASRRSAPARRTAASELSLRRADRLCQASFNVASAVSTSNTSVQVMFDGPPDSQLAMDLANYTIQGAERCSSAALALGQHRHADHLAAERDDVHGHGRKRHARRRSHRARRGDSCGVRRPCRVRRHRGELHRRRPAGRQLRRAARDVESATTLAKRRIPGLPRRAGRPWSPAAR